MIVMDYCEFTLSKKVSWLRSTTSGFSEAEIRKIITQIVPAIVRLHNLGYAHMDLKPGSVNLLRQYFTQLEINTIKSLNSRKNKPSSSISGFSWHVMFNITSLEDEGQQISTCRFWDLCKHKHCPLELRSSRGGQSLYAFGGLSNEHK